MSTPEIQLTLANEAATQALGKDLAEIVLKTLNRPQTGALGTAGAAIYLQGELGAGKTSLVRSFLREAGVTGRIKSPSYALLESYKVSSLYLYHIDFYRFNDPREWEDAGFRELFTSNAVVMIEWPEKAAGQLPPPDLLVCLEYDGLQRTAQIQAKTTRGEAWLRALSLTRAKRPSATPSPGASC